jgi:hypothetical protein
MKKIVFGQSVRWISSMRRLEAHSNTCYYITFILLCIEEEEVLKFSFFLGHECAMLCFVYLADEEEQKRGKRQKR